MNIDLRVFLVNSQNFVVVTSTISIYENKEDQKKSTYFMKISNTSRVLVPI